MEQEKKTRRSRVGMVVSDKSEKTIKVQIEGIQQHPVYKKFIKRQHRFLVHDPKEECKLGDIVRIEECRPVSKNKKWVVREIITRADSKTADSLKEAENDQAGINS